ncbi:hypothetical protein LOZ80_38080 [Paenibacillus sp. HWE-109]|uniref:hypothetical protein n=1 Tax=Paenibacillus sp. HWE-109 TaxID=1306526 RepID=UPI001EE0C69A|nr:hypothetical protein [Paenibacillus sp. HWE-109]UKS27202.1 hypothetical protein LOZ80_38080 [Paenibacillus sp. HWE-109]
MAKLKSELERIVLLFNEGTSDFEGRWDGKDILLEPGDSVEVQAGVAEHLIQRHEDADLRIEEIEKEEIETREPGNPLETNNRGTAFGKLKKAAAKDTE